MYAKETILITDDSPLNRRLLADILGDHYEYLYAEDGVQALELLNRRFDIDPLLLDINMPRLDGFGVLETLRRRGAELPVVVISSEGDDIPISAQVVALADVYDALTSDRCYKTAYSHNTAVAMILNGECGAFNPLLLDCLSAAADRLRSAADRAPTLFDYQQESHRLTAEMLGEDPAADSPAWQQLPVEQAKTDFFTQQCGGIQFVYDRWMGLVTYTDWTAPEGPRRWSFPISDKMHASPMDPDDQSRLHWRIRDASPQRPGLTMNAQLTVDGKLRPFRLHARVIWPAGGVAYACVVGRFVPLDEPS